MTNHDSKGQCLKCKSQSVVEENEKMHPSDFLVCDETLCEERCKEGGKNITPQTCDYRKLKGLEYEGQPHKTCSTCDGYTTNEEPTICDGCKDELHKDGIM